MSAAARAGAVAVAAILAAPAAAADPVMPLGEVQPGMVGEARTVVQGTTIERFPVRVLDVQRTAAAVGGPLIIARAEGPLMERTGGVAEGMSGSPVYVTGADGVQRVIGAIAFGSGDQANVIVGVTPIERMVAAARATTSPATRSAAARGPVRLVAGRRAAVRVERRHPGARALYPLRRWMVAGASPSLLGPLRRRLRSEGVQLTAVGVAPSRPATPLVPGATLAALLSAGDLAAGAIGTVTYVDGRTVIGFGHPFLGAGASRFLLADGHVLQTIPAPILGASYKLAEPGALQGTVVGDHLSGIVGRVGVPRGVRVVSRATDLDRGSRNVARSLVAPDARALALLAPLLSGEPALVARDGIGPGTLRLRIAIESPALARPLVYRNVYAASGDVIGLANGELERLVTVLGQNGLRRVGIARIEVSQTLRDRVDAARIVGAAVRPRRVRAGRTATLVLALQPWRAERRVVRRRFRVPPDLPPGPVALRVVPNSPGGFSAEPPSFDGEVSEEATPARGRAALARVERRAAAANGPRTQRLLDALRAVGPGRHDAIRLLEPGQQTDGPRVGTVIRVPPVISGGRAVARLTVR